MKRKEFLAQSLAWLWPPGMLIKRLLGLEQAQRRHQLGFFVDMEKCVGCRACEAACKEYNALPVGVRWRKVRAREGGAFPDSSRVFMSLACNHCEKPACVAACPVKAYSKTRLDGIVEHSKERCIGCKYCTWACPYQVPQYEKEAKKVHKCELCKTRIDKGLKPMCVHVCPTGALDYGNIDEFARRHEEVSREALGFPNISITTPSTRFRLPKKLYADMRKVIDKDVDKKEQA